MNLVSLFIIWLIIAAVTILVLFRKRTNHAGFALAYILDLTMVYAFFIPSLLVYEQRLEYDLDIVRLGFQQAVIGLATFCGVLLFPKLRSRQYTTQNPVKTPPEASTHARQAITVNRLAWVYIGIGFVSAFLLPDFIRRIPTMSSVVSAASNLFFVGCMLLVIHSRNTGKNSLFWLTNGMASLWLVLEVFLFGFLGFALRKLLITGAFIVATSRLRWRSVLWGALAVYVVFSFALTYWSLRGFIRGSLWYGTTGITSSLDVAEEVIGSFSFFVFDEDRVDLLTSAADRMNFAYPAGLVVSRLDNGFVEPLNGETYTNLALAVIPRAIWPSKPFRAGGAENFTSLTGIPIASGTSVDTDIVLESYANFGTFGVMLIMAILAIWYRRLDKKSYLGLQNRNYYQFATHAIVAMGLLKSSGNTTTTFVTAVSSYITVLLINHVIQVFAAYSSEPEAAIVTSPENASGD